MEWIARQQYVKVHREVDSIEQRDIEQERFIYLYPDRVVTEHRSFPIQDVMDVSHKEVSGDKGLFYLHTTGGVFSYIVKESPESFIQSFREIIE